jgi:nucleoside-diphosphate-sugar epimerase
MASALIGHTGFVGGNLAAQHRFDDFYNSKNIESIAGRAYDLLVVSGMPAAMWIANKDPAADRAVLDRLVQAVRQANAERVVLISTVAVYPTLIDVDEDSSIDVASQTPYGRHRLQLEQELSGRFSRLLIVRLPGLFGTGLKKNVVYDLLHNHEVHKLNAANTYQFFNLDRLWDDVSKAWDCGAPIVNFTTEPTSVREVARAAFDLEFTNDVGSPAVHFNVRSRYAAHFGGKAGYFYSRRQVLDELRAFVSRERGAEFPA